MMINYSVQTKTSLRFRTKKLEAIKKIILEQDPAAVFTRVDVASADNMNLITIFVTGNTLPHFDDPEIVAEELAKKEEQVTIEAVTPVKKVPAPPRGWKVLLTPAIEEELRKLVEEAEWPPPEDISEEFSEILIACDYAFTGEQLKTFCKENGLSASGHKKMMCGRLLRLNIPPVPEVTVETLQKLKSSSELKRLKEFAKEEIRKNQADIKKLHPYTYNHFAIDV